MFSVHVHNQQGGIIPGHRDPQRVPRVARRSSCSSLQHKAVKDEGGQKAANAPSCLHTTGKAMNLSNLSEVKPNLLRWLHKTCSNVLALMQR